MPYVTKYRTKYKTIEKDLGYEEISIIRPRFVFFQFEGLRPSTPHWLFFDGKQVNRWVNTSYNLDDFNAEAKNSALRNPGDKYIKATKFPSQHGGPTNLNGPLNTDNTGKLEGLFYIQSNSTTNFPTGTRTLTAIDISVLKPDDCLSIGEAEYQAIGEYELYYTYQKKYQESYQVWVSPPPPNNDNGGNDGPAFTMSSQKIPAGDGSYSWSYTTTNNITGTSTTSYSNNSYSNSTSNWSSSWSEFGSDRTSSNPWD